MPSMEVDLYERNNTGSLSVDAQLAAANDLSDPTIMTKYRLAADIANFVMHSLNSKVVSGASIVELCKYGDQLIEQQTALCFKKQKNIEKGIAFPTSISVNNILMNHSPMNDDHQTCLQNGDVVSL